MAGGLLPREHGAYVQLGFPLLTGLLYSGGHPGAVAFTVAAIALFLAHEPMAVIAGVRGVRLQEELHAPARRRILFLSGAALAGMVAAIGLAPARAWIGAVLPAGIALLMLPLIGTKRMKSIPAEILAAAVFSTAVLPLALCGDGGEGARLADPLLLQAALAAAVWFAAIVPAIFAVHAMKAAVRKRPEELWVLRAAPLVAAGFLTAVIGSGLLLPLVRDLLAAIPPVVAALVIARRPPHPRYLMHIGWTMVAADTLALLLLLLL